MEDSTGHYVIYYRIVGSEAVVYRVLDCRRDPKWIRRALEKKPVW